MVTKSPEKPATEQRLQMSYEEFLTWADEDTHAEWVNGEVIVFIPPRDVHQAIMGFLYRLIAEFADLFDLGQVRTAPNVITTLYQMSEETAVAIQERLQTE